MNHLLGLLVLFLSHLAHPHGGDSGPSTLEQEFSKMAHLHLPINYSTSDGYYLGYEIGKLEKGLVFENHPIAFGGFDKIVHKTCLNESASKQIEICPENAPFVVLENKKWDLGLGFESHIHLPLPGVGLGAGIAYIKGKNYYSLRSLNSKNERRSALNFPVNAQEFKQWRVGDQLSYMGKGTLVFNVFVGFEPFVHLGPQISKTGVYRLSMRKTNNDSMVVELGSLKSKDFSFENYAIVLGGEFSIGKAKASSVTYEFNMKDENSYTLLATLLAGRIDIVNQGLALGLGNIMMKNESLNRGHSFSGNFGFPILFLNGGYRGTYVSNGTMEEMEEGKLHLHDVYSISKVKDHFTRGPLSKHAWLNQTLITSIVREKDEPENSIISVVLNWTFSRDSLSQKQLQNRLSEAAQTIGVKQLQDLMVPDFAKGYVKVDVSLNLAAAQVLKVLSEKEKQELRTFQSKNDYPGMNQSLMKFMKKHFSHDPKEFYKTYAPQVEIHLEGENLTKTTLRL